jgi:Alr-MurF fusion protein
MSAYLYTARKIAEITNGKLFPGNKPDGVIYHLVIDSRKPVSIQADVFFAIVTQRNDGHKYISELIEKGIRNFVISSEPKPEWMQSNASFVLVNDTLDALQALAAHRRGLFNIPVIGITGSNGKTIVKEWLWQLMGNDRQVVRNPKSYNSQIGVPLSVWQMDGNTNLEFLRQGFLCLMKWQNWKRLSNPFGIFTNLGPAHDENFESGLQKGSEKLELFRNCNELICCADHKQIIEAYNSLLTGIANQN